MSRSLDVWMSAPSSSPSGVRSRLGEIAWNRAVDVAAASAGIAGGASCVLFGAYWSFFALTPVPIIAFGLLGAVLILVGVLAIRRARMRLPNERILRVVRGPRSAAGAIAAAATIWVLIATIMIVSWISQPASYPGADVLLIGFLVFFALLLVSCLVVPGIVVGRANSSLRTLAARSATYRALLEQDRLSWYPRLGDRPYGPL